MSNYLGKHYKKLKEMAGEIKKLPVLECFSLANETLVEVFDYNGQKVILWSKTGERQDVGCFQITFGYFEDNNYNPPIRVFCKKMPDGRSFVFHNDKGPANFKESHCSFLIHGLPPEKKLIKFLKKKQLVCKLMNKHFNKNDKY